MASVRVIKPVVVNYPKKALIGFKEVNVDCLWVLKIKVELRPSTFRSRYLTPVPVFLLQPPPWCTATKPKDLYSQDPVGLALIHILPGIEKSGPGSKTADLPFYLHLHLPTLYIYTQIYRYVHWSTSAYQSTCATASPLKQCQSFSLQLIHLSQI